MIGIQRTALSFVALTAAAGVVYWKGYRHAEAVGRAAVLSEQHDVLTDALSRALDEMEAQRLRAERGAEAEAEADAALEVIDRQPLEVAHVAPLDCPVPDLDGLALRMRDEDRLRARRNAALHRAGRGDDGGS